MNIKKQGDKYIVTQELAGLLLIFRHKSRLIAIKNASNFILALPNQRYRQN